MSNNQLHGIEYQNIIRSYFIGVNNIIFSPLALWDIEAHYDQEFNLPTSIKVTKNNTVPLSDARRFWEINEAWRLLVGIYEQKTTTEKYFYKLIEFLISQEEHASLLGNVPFDDVNYFHEKLKEYPVGSHKECREFAKEHKKTLPDSKIKLNPKIDSKNQRRLQCSVTLKTLNENILKQETYTEFYRDGDIRQTIKSSQREFENKN